VRSGRYYTAKDMDAVAAHGGEFVALSYYSTISDDNGTWSHDDDTSNNIYDPAAAVWAGTRFLALTGGGEAYLRDTSGWTKASDTSAIDTAVNDVAWLGASAVAVGDSGAVFTSSAGDAWAARDSGVTTNLNGITWSGSLAVAVGNDGTVVTSGDGSSWSEVDAGTQTDLNDVAWTGSAFVAVGDQTEVLVSTGGSQWQAVDTGNARCTLNGVAANGDSVLGVGASGCYMTSDDGGNTWTEGDTNVSRDFYDVIAMDDGSFRAIGEDGVIIEFD
jgi:hypothetical protein